MSKLLDGLNSAQQKAVTHKDGPLLIIAGPGSGKTRTIACSIAYAIENLEVDPSKIAAFTFTNKAKDELKNKVSDFVVEQDIVNDVWISTFHSFCGHVWHNHPGKLIIENERDFTAEELTRVYKMRYQIDRLQHHKFVDDKEILNTIKQWEKQDISPARISNQEVSQICVDVYNKYKQILEDSSDIFTKIQLFTNALLRDAPEVRTKWQEKFELIFVDEFQDTDPIQYEIIKVLAGEDSNLRVVGDDDQSIYGWRGADIQNILNFENDYSIDDPITLGENYRSTQRIVKASRALAEFNPDRREKELFTRNCEGERVIHLHCESNEEEAAIIATFVHQAINQGSRSPSDFAVLYRTKEQAHAFKKAFKDLGIQPHIVKSSLDTPDNVVSLMTIHQSKGLEFPNVFVAGVCSGLLPHYNSKEEDWGEELRLLYVAMTRAKNWLCLSSYEVDTKHKRGRSPFLKYIPKSLLESVKTLENTPIPPRPKKIETVMIKEPSDYEPLPEKLLGDGMTVIGVDPGNIGACETNVGWSVTRKDSDGYSVLDHSTEHPTGSEKDRLKQIQHTIKHLVDRYSPHAIAVEKLEVATKKEKKNWFYYVAGCVADIRRIADQHGIECRLYTPQQVKYAATDNRNASKEDVQKAVMRICNLRQIPEPHHSADAIAASLCYLRSHLNSSRFEGDRRKQECNKAGYDYLNTGQYEAAAVKFKEAINIDPIYTKAHCGLGRAYLGQGDLEAAENTAKTALRLAPNDQLVQALLEDLKHIYHNRGIACMEAGEYNKAINLLRSAYNIDRNDKAMCMDLADAYCLMVDYTTAAIYYRKVTEMDPGNKIAYFELGNAYYRMGEHEKAVDPFQRASDLDPMCERKFYCLVLTYFKLGNLEEAVLAVEKVLHIVPTYQDALELLKEIEDKRKLMSTDTMILIPSGKFYIDKLPVTNAQYLKFIDANPQWSKDYIDEKYHDGNYLKHWSGNSYPSNKGKSSVIHISWYAAMAYAKWVGKRLPTEAELKKVVQNRWMMGKNAIELVNEWCLDEYEQAYYQSQDDSQKRARVFNCFWVHPSFAQFSFVGFRCVKPIGS